MLKKSIMTIGIFAVLLFLGLKISYGFVSGNDYYIKITESGVERNEYQFARPSSSDEEGIHYSYLMKAYNKSGQMILVNFDTKKNLELNAYYKVTVTNPQKEQVNGVQHLEQVEANEVPQKAMHVLKNY